jgi:hypothetical protein
MRFMVSRPRSIGLLTVLESAMAIQFAVVLPEPPAVLTDWNEIASGLLTVRIAGQDPILIGTEKSAQESAERLVEDPRFSAPQGTLVDLEFSYIDDADNVGGSVFAASVLTDTVPPVLPGAIGLKSIGETPDVPVVPPVDPPIEEPTV